MWCRGRAPPPRWSGQTGSCGAAAHCSDLEWFHTDCRGTNHPLASSRVTINNKDAEEQSFRVVIRLLMDVLVTLLLLLQLDGGWTFGSICQAAPSCLSCRTHVFMFVFGIRPLTRSQRRNGLYGTWTGFDGITGVWSLSSGRTRGSCSSLIYWDHVSSWRFSSRLALMIQQKVPCLCSWTFHFLSWSNQNLQVSRYYRSLDKNSKQETWSECSSKT